jgi:dTDP-4-amino-4,6-dideoxygalactose transaminase
MPPRPFDPTKISRRQQECLQSGLLKFGNQWTNKLTKVLADRIQVPDDKSLLLTNSGTSALRLALIALMGERGGEGVVVMPSYTFNATAEAVRQLGYKIRFCDVCPLTWTLEPSALKEALDRGGCRLVVTVDSLGNPSDYNAIRAICDQYGVRLLADSAPSLGAVYRDRPVGTQADAHAFSMSFAKVVSAGGAGGAVIIPAEAERLITEDANWWRSSQMPEMAAVVALDQVERLDELIERRTNIANIYNTISEQCSSVIPQKTTGYSSHAWVHWVAIFNNIDRSRIQSQLSELGIGTKPYYYPALHTLTWGDWAEKASLLPVTSLLDSQALALPMSSEINSQTAEQIAFTVSRLMKQ